MISERPQSHVIAKGAHPIAIQQRLGHASITTTFNTYGHMFPSLDVDIADRLEVSMGIALAEHNLFRSLMRGIARTSNNPALGTLRCLKVLPLPIKTFLTESPLIFTS